MNSLRFSSEMSPARRRNSQAAKPLVKCQVHFLAEIVHVADQTCHDLTVAWRNVL